MASTEKGIMLSLMPDEEVVCKARAGRLSFARFLPSRTIIATNKRLFAISHLKVFSRYNTLYYEKMDGIDVKKGLLGSELTVRTGSDAKPRGFVFYKHGELLSMFSVISNQISAQKDSNHRDRLMAESLDARYAVLNTGVAFAPPKAAEVTHLSKLARFEEGARKRIEPEQTAPLQIELPRPMIEQQDTFIAKPAGSQVPHISGVSNILAVTQKLYNHFRGAGRMHPGKVEVGYFADGKVLAPERALVDFSDETVVMRSPNFKQLYKQKEVMKRKFDPDNDMKIFKIRRMRSGAAKQSVPATWRVNPFSLFNTK